MTVITRKEDDVIVVFATTHEIVDTGIFVDNAFILSGSEQFNIFENVTIPDGALPQANKYTEAGGFVKNPDYVPYVSPEDRIIELENQTAEYMVDLDFRISNIELGL